MRVSNRDGPRSRSLIPRGGRDQRPREDGAVAVEFAAVAMLFIAILYGIMVFGLVFALNHTMTHAASEGARAAITAPPDSDPADIEQVAIAAAEDRMSWLPASRMPDAEATLAECENETDQDCITVTISYDYADRPLIPNLPGLGIVIPDEMIRHAVLQVSQ